MNYIKLNLISYSLKILEICNIPLKIKGIKKINFLFNFPFFASNMELIHPFNLFNIKVRKFIN